MLHSPKQTESKLAKYPKDSRVWLVTGHSPDLPLDDALLTPFTASVHVGSSHHQRPTSSWPLPWWMKLILDMLADIYYRVSGWSCALSTGKHMACFAWGQLKASTAGCALTAFWAYQKSLSQNFLEMGDGRRVTGVEGQKLCLRFLGERIHKSTCLVIVCAA